MIAARAAHQPEDGQEPHLEHPDEAPDREPHPGGRLRGPQRDRLGGRCAQPVARARSDVSSARRSASARVRRPRAAPRAGRAPARGPASPPASAARDLARCRRSMRQRSASSASACGVAVGQRRLDASRQGAPTPPCGHAESSAMSSISGMDPRCRTARPIIRLGTREHGPRGPSSAAGRPIRLTFARSRFEKLNRP